MGDPSKMTRRAQNNEFCSRHETADRNDGALASSASAKESAALIALDRLDSDSRAEVEALARIVGASVDIVVRRGAPDPRMVAGMSWRGWKRSQLERIFRTGATSVETRVREE